MLSVQAGLIDALPLPLVPAFVSGLREALDRGAADAVRSIQSDGALDDPGKAKLRACLQTYVQTLTPAKPA